MEADRWRRIEELFLEAAELPPGDRSAFLDQACDDKGLRHEVEALLAADEPDKTLLQAVIIQAAAELPEGSDGPDLEGTRIGPYTIQGLIGKGGMGAVYRAVREDDFRMQVAIKLLKRGTDTDAALSRFRAERQMLAGLQHPNIAHMLDGGATESGLPYLVMEYVDGTPLLKYATPLTVRQRLELFRAVCSAVQYAHQNLIVHRDIKPDNILVTRDGTPKLLDFGIAKLLDAPERGATQAVTATGVRLMTPDYASPEQVRGEPITTATDVFSLGAVLYELLTGKRAHHIEAYSAGEIEREICTRQPKKPSTVAKQLDPDLDNIVLMALRKEPQRRYPSVERFAEDIRLYLEGRPVTARKDTVSYRAGKFMRRNRLGVAVAALVVVGVISGVAAVQRQARRAEHRFSQVRKLANTVLTDLDDGIAPLAGSTKVRELLVKTSLEYLDSLAAEAGGDPALQLELAAAYIRIGTVQGSPQLSNLGQPKAALESYRKGLAIAQRIPSSPAATEITGNANLLMGAVYHWTLGRASEGENHVRTAIAITDSLPKMGRPAYGLRVHARETLGDMLTYRDAAAALEPLRRGLELCREWISVEHDYESRFVETMAMTRLGAADQETGNLVEGAELFSGALRLVDQLLQAQPDNARFRRERGTYYERLGWVAGHPQYFNLGDRKQAIGWIQKSLAEMERELISDPADLRARFDFSEALAELAAVSRESDTAGAAKLYRRSLDLNASVLKTTPEDTYTAYEQAFNRVGFAWVLEHLHKPGEALTQLDIAIELLRKLAGQHADDARFREYLGLSLHTRAAHRLHGADRAGAARDLDNALAILEPLYRDNPRRLTRLQDLADCYQGFGDLSASRSEWTSAQSWYRKSLDLWDRWKQVGTSSVYDQQLRDAAASRYANAVREVQRSS